MSSTEIQDATEDELELHRITPRPRTRGDCARGPRPCPWVGCRHHLYLEVNPQTGSIAIRHAGGPEDLAQSCSLDVADEGGVTLEVVGGLLNITRERVRQVEAKTLRLIGRAGRRLLGA